MHKDPIPKHSPTIERDVSFDSEMNDVILTEREAASMRRIMTNGLARRRINLPNDHIIVE